jgi:hypothetical protein
LQNARIGGHLPSGAGIGRSSGEYRFNLAYIGSDFTQKLPEPFDQAYMRALFDYGYQRARRGYDWAKQPPV